MNFQRFNLKILAKNGMFSFKVFLLFRVRVVGGRIAEKESILARKKVVTIVSFGFSQMWKKTVMLRLLGQLSQLF